MPPSSLPSVMVNPMGEITAGERRNLDDVDEWTHGGSHVARYRPEHDVKLLHVVFLLCWSKMLRLLFVSDFADAQYTGVNIFCFIVTLFVGVHFRVVVARGNRGFGCARPYSKRSMCTLRRTTKASGLGVVSFVARPISTSLLST